MTAEARCDRTDLPIGTCAEACCRRDLAGETPAPMVRMRAEVRPPRKPRPAPTAEAAPRLTAAASRRTEPSFSAPVAGAQYQLVDMARELCEGTRHRQPYHLTLTGITRHHATSAPPLLDQLARAIAPSRSSEAGTVRPSSSRPAARLDAIDTGVRIETDASRWLRRLDLDDTGDVVDLVRRLTPHALTDNELARDVRRWWTWARIITGWDLPAWQPDNTCPLCGVRGMLRVRVAEKLATCINDACRETWDETTIGLLAEHIRSENCDPLDDTA